MRHQIYGRHLGRNTKKRKQLFRNLVVSVIRKGRIVTTISKAKAVQPLIDRLVTYAKDKSLGIQRLALADLGNNQAVWFLLVNKVAQVFKDTPGGYTRIIKIGQRHGDNAMEVILEWSKKVEEKTDTKKIPEKPKRQIKTKKGKTS